MINFCDRSRIVLLSLLQVVVCCSASATDNTQSPSSEGRPDYCGVWGIWGGERVSTEGRPWFKGVVVTSEWKRIEPRRGEFSWDVFDRKVQEVVDKDLSVMIMIYHGHKVADWVYDQGVPRVETDARQHKFHPYYLDPAYKPLLSRMIHATAEHVAAYPPEIRARVIGVQCPTGKSGDPQPYDGEPLEEKYRIDSRGDAWVAWTLGMFPVYHKAYDERGLDVFLMFKGPNPQSNDWLMEHMQDSWRKPHMIAQGYQFNNELRVMDELYPRTRRRIDGVLIRTRGELDHTADKGQNWFNAAPVWNVYWAGLWNLTYGTDIWNQLAPALEDERFVPAFEFVSRYAGYKTPAESPGAWIALRDGLDCADTKRFPEDQFGPIGKSKPWQASPNLDRYQRIAEAFAKFGAATIVIIWGDHGWHLSEKLHYGKTTLWEESARVPLLVSVPGVTQGGGKCDGVVNLIDLYPTLVELCGLPGNKANEGRSFASLLREPTIEWNHPTLTTQGFQNHSLTDGRYRYIRHGGRGDGAEELYDHANDPMEWNNLANQPKYEAIKSRFQEFLPKQDEPDSPANRAAGRVKADAARQRTLNNKRR